MTRIVVKELVWDEYNIEHIGKHNVLQREVEEVAKNIAVHKRAKKGRFMIIGRSGLRILSIVINRNGPGKYYPISARDSDKKERQILYEKEKK